MKKPKGRHAWTAKVGEKGQIVIPKEARDIFDIHPGDTLLILGDEKRGIALAKAEALPELFSLILGEERGKESDDGDSSHQPDKGV